MFPLNLAPWQAIPLQTSSSQTELLFSIPLVSILIVGFLVVAILIVLGTRRHQPLLISSGIMLAGVIIAATPVGVYVRETFRLGGTLEASAFDFVLVAIFASVGGAIAALGALRYSGERTPPSR